MAIIIFLLKEYTCYHPYEGKFDSVNYYKEYDSNIIEYELDEKEKIKMKLFSQDELVYIEEDLHNLTIISELYYPSDDDSDDGNRLGGHRHADYEYNLYYNDKYIGIFKSLDNCKKVRDEIISFNNDYQHSSSVYKVPNRY